MVPLHYFLALFAILVSLMGCTQRMPPGSSQAIEVSNNTSEDTTQTLNGGNNPMVKPSTADVASFQLIAPNAGEWDLVFTGADAKILYGLLEVQPKKEVEGKTITNTKTGVNMVCTENTIKQTLTQVTDECVLKLNSSNAELAETSKQDDLKLDPKNADVTISSDQKIQSSYFQFDPVSVGKFGRLAIYGDDAKNIYDKLSISAQAIDTSGKRKGIQGKHAACYEEFLGTDTTPSYRCNFFFNYDSGAFDEIKLLQ